MMYSRDPPDTRPGVITKLTQLCIISRSAHRTTNFTNPEFQFPQSKVLQSVFIFLYKELYWHFRAYCDVNLKLLPCKNTQKVNKQKIRCKNSGFVLVVRMS